MSEQWIHLSDWQPAVLRSLERYCLVWRSECTNTEHARANSWIGIKVRVRPAASNVAWNRAQRCGCRLWEIHPDDFRKLRPDQASCNNAFVRECMIDTD